MKYLILTLALLEFSCSTGNQTDHRWIRSYSESTMTGARYAVEDRRYSKNDSSIIVNMERVRHVISNIYDSIPNISKSEILKRTQPLIDDMMFGSSTIEEFFTLTENSSDNDFKLQLALLEFELLSDYVKRIGMKDVTFDTLELRFVPTEISNERIVGELLFLASSNNLVDEAKMYVNGKEIEIIGRTGIVDISRDQLTDGNFKASIEFEYADLDIETDIEVIKE